MQTGRILFMHLLDRWCFIRFVRKDVWRTCFYFELSLLAALLYLAKRLFRLLLQHFSSTVLARRETDYDIRHLYSCYLDLLSCPLVVGGPSRVLLSTVLRSSPSLSNRSNCSGSES
jgi:hypothetical protein